MILLVILVVVGARQTGFFGASYQSAPIAEVRLDSFDADLAALPLLPRLGNPDGSRRIVEFFDYRCPHCRRMAPVLHEMTGEDPQLDLVMIELPVLGDASVLKARYALAAALQDGYGPFHRALMFTEVEGTDAALSAMGAALGLDPARLKADAHGPQVDAALEANRHLAATYGIDGTPTVLVGNQLIVGEIDKGSLLDLLAAVPASPAGASVN